MAAWGNGPWDNEAAAGWACDLEQAAPEQRPAMVRAALARAADESQYVKAPTAAAGIAAAAVVAAVRLGVCPGQTQAPAFLAADPGALALPEDLDQLARQALDRVTSDQSEWRELWPDDTELARALVAVHGLRDSLPG